ncbi:MAG: hypothetical protein D6730_06310 [Bacteroidetes bacterium]|nr:MAG: hypothetical protein D6730_06310 [Bacteroidota bacterium]
MQYHRALHLACFLCWIATLFGLPAAALAQEQGMRTVRAIRTQEPIKLDGILDEAIWQRTQPADSFWQYFPSDTCRSLLRTEIHFAYDEQNLYVAVVCYSVGDAYVISSLKRDYRASSGDNITLVFDPFRDRTNAFVFGINPYGVRREALVSGGGRQIEDFNTSWDNKWDGEAKIYPDRWIGEFAIPFKTLRFRQGESEWFFNAYRFDTQTNERSIWAHVPRNFIIMDRAYNGRLLWEEPLGKPGANISLIPYLLGGLSQDFEERQPAKGNWNIGGDAKIALSPSLNLDLTLNPDFSQVEVDDQVTNLDRFEIFFPEKRQFFLENSDLFANLGTERIRPFFSRRIGVAQDTATGVNVQNPIYYGMRISGKLNNLWRLGFLNMQTAPVDENGDPSFNFTVATLQRQLFKRSFFSAFLVNKQAFSDSTGSLYVNPHHFNRVLGLDYNLATANNHWQGKVFLHRSFSQLENETGTAQSGGLAQGARLEYTRRRFGLGLEQQWVEDTYEAQTGFVPRHGFLRFLPKAQLFFYPSKGPFNVYGPGIEADLIFNHEMRKTDQIISLTQEFQLSNTARMRINLNHNYIYLQQDFDPSRSGLDPLPAETEYSYVDLNGFFFSDNRKKLSWLGRGSIGQLFNGWRVGATCSLTYRIQPFGAIAATLGYNYLQIPHPETGEKRPVSLFLIGPKIDLTFTRKLFFTTFVQYNSQRENLNINARFQWRFQPVSDFFLVYTDNYLARPDGLMVRNRAVVAKLTYWLNL